jgi:hypothetical protein
MREAAIKGPKPSIGPSGLTITLLRPRIGVRELSIDTRELSTDAQWRSWRWRGQ